MSIESTILSEKVAKAAEVAVPIPGFVECLSQTLPVDETEHDDLDLVKEWLWRRLEKLGIYKDEDSHAILISDDCAEGDARRTMCENGEPNLPVARFKRIWGILKASNTQDTKPPAEVPQNASFGTVEGIVVQTLLENVKDNKPLGQWTDSELLEKYGPEASSAIIEELEKRSKGRPCIIFKDEIEGVVETEASLRLLKEARKRETPVNYKMQDVLKRVFVAGDFPTTVFHECPLHGDVLLIDDYCDECGHSWEGVDAITRQFVRLIEEEDEAPREKPSLRQLINDARQGGIDLIKGDYPKVFNVFKERETEDGLPSLKRRTAVSGVARSDPFSPGKKRY